MLKKISLSALALTMSVGTAFAQDEMPAEQPAETAAAAPSSGGGKNPVAYAKRGLTMGAGTVRIDYSNAGFGITDYPGVGGFGGGRGLNLNKIGDMAVNVGLGASVGIIENLEAGLLFLPLALSPSAGYGDMGLYGRYRFMSGNFELGAQVGLRIPTSTDFGLSLGLPALIRLGDGMRIDTGVVVNMSFTDPMVVGLGVPVLLALQIADPFWAGLRTGFGIATFDAAGDSILVPLGVAAGYTVAMNGTVSMLDITAEFVWPGFISTANPDTIVADVFSIIIGANLYLDLF